MPTLINIDGPESFLNHFNVSRETLTSLELYVELLRKWQKVVNLVASSTLDDIWQRHIGDSAQIVDILNKSDSLQKSGNWLDIGSGGGFPGLVAAIMLSENSEYRFHLVESNGRKCAFLADVVRHLDLPVDIHNQRIEQFGQCHEFTQVSIMSARALAALDSLMKLSEPFITAQTVTYFFKGRGSESELVMARKKWEFHCKQFESRTNLDGRILEITGLKRRP